MYEDLIIKLNILKKEGLKPNFASIAKDYGIDWRTVKKYYNGYSKPTTRNKPSKLDKYADIIKDKLKTEHTTVKSIYNYIYQNIDSSIGSYSNFNHYINTKGLKPKK